MRGIPGLRHVANWTSLTRGRCVTNSWRRVVRRRAVFGPDAGADDERVARRERELRTVAELTRERARVEPAPPASERRLDLDRDLRSLRSMRPIGTTGRLN